MDQPDVTGAADIVGTGIGDGLEQPHDIGAGADIIQPQDGADAGADIVQPQDGAEAGAEHPHAVLGRRALRTFLIGII